MGINLYNLIYQKQLTLRDQQLLQTSLSYEIFLCVKVLYDSFCKTSLLHYKLVIKNNNVANRAAITPQNSARTCILTTAQTLLHFKVIGQRSRSQDRIIGFFIIARYGKTFFSTITHAAWWYFVQTCTRQPLEPYWISRS